MSGMEPLAALGIACNIMQIVSFGQETVKNCKAVYKTGHLDPDLTPQTSHIDRLCDELRQVSTLTTYPLRKQDQELVALARTCEDAARRLSDEITNINPESEAGGSRRKAAWIGVKAMWRRRALRDLEKRLSSAQETLESRLLARVCATTEAAAVLQTDEFCKLNNTLQAFIQRYSEGHALSEISRLLQQESADIKAHVTNTIATHAALQKESKQLKTQLERLLGSLKYPMMNDRRNNISTSFQTTFKWVFRNAGIDDDDEESSDGSLEDSDNDERRTKHEIWDDFAKWLQSNDSKPYWISGKPGSGKSTLMKYLIRHTKTPRLLNQWATNTLIVSHFIWSAGTEMEKSIKGLLCCLLHQLLKERPTSIQPLFEGNASAREKESYSDWAVDELEAAILSILATELCPTCIFIDGLDEISSTDGPLPLIALLRRFSHLSSVKLCVSSRPEPAFTKALERYPHLRLQDLTAIDIWRYASSRIESMTQGSLAHGIGDDPQESKAGLHELLSEILRKADGVFLWVCLALKSLEEGYVRGDDIATLHRRLDLLPSDLDDLYFEMWNRLGDAKSLYQDKAARMFSVVLACDLAIAETPIVTVAEMMTVLQPGLFTAIVEDGDVSLFTPQYLLEMCEQTKKEAESCSAGLLQVIPSTGGYKMELSSTNIDSPWSHDILPYANSHITLIHRSAKAFFGTSRGQSILPLSLEGGIPARASRDLLLATLAWNRLIHTTAPALSLRIMFSSLFDFQITGQELFEVFNTYWRLWDSGYLQDRYNRLPIGCRPDLPALAADAGLSRFVLSALDRIHRNRIFSVDYLSYILHFASNMSFSPCLFATTDEALQTFISVATWLISKGADPNLKYPTQARKLVESRVADISTCTDKFLKYHAPSGNVPAPHRSIKDIFNKIRRSSVISFKDGLYLMMEIPKTIFTGGEISVLGSESDLRIDQSLALLIEHTINSYNLLYFYNTSKEEDMTGVYNIKTHILFVGGTQIMFGGFIRDSLAYRLDGDECDKFLDADLVSWLISSSNENGEFLRSGISPYETILQRARTIVNSRHPLSQEEYEDLLVERGAAAYVSDLKEKYPPNPFEDSDEDIDKEILRDVLRESVEDIVKQMDKVREVRKSQQD